MKAILKNARISAQKGRLVADLIRNQNVSRAVDILTYTPKKGARILLKLLQSVIANAENNHSADIDELRVDTVYVNEAATFKRMEARAKGRGNRISKRNCHITITLV